MCVRESTVLFQAKFESRMNHSKIEFSVHESMSPVHVLY
jgi:hypothetical protein